MSIPQYHLSSERGLYSFIPGYGWEPVMAWATSADGTRQRTNQQERNEEGEGLWKRFAHINRISFGSSAPETIELRTWAMTKPSDDDFSDSWETGNE